MIVLSLVTVVWKHREAFCRKLASAMEEKAFSMLPMAVSMEEIVQVYLHH